MQVERSLKYIRFLLLYIGLWLAIDVSGQVKSAKKFAKTITTEDLFKHLSVLAADSLEGRETGQPGADKAAAYIARHFEAIGLKPAVILPDSIASFFQPYEVNRENSVLNGTNVIGFIPGTLWPEEYLVISSHYDHLGIGADGKINNGADDDGSGTVAIMEIAEAFMKSTESGKGPKRSIVFICFSGEEKGLLGSKHYTQNPVFPLANTIVNLNIDMIGRMDKKHADKSAYVYLIGSDKLSQDLHVLSEYVNKQTVKLKLDYTFNQDDDPNRFYYRSDHYNFAQKNIPVIFYFNGTHADYHKPTDTIEKIEFGLLKKRAWLVFYTAWEIANREEKLKLN